MAFLKNKFHIILIALSGFSYTALFASTLDPSVDLSVFLREEVTSYKSGNWDKFFGLAFYYRKNLLGTLKRPEPLFLESAALFNFCLNEESARVLSLAERYVSRADELTLQKIKDLKGLYALREDLLKKTKNSTQSLELVKWPLSSKTLPENPYFIRVKVRSRCEG